MGDILDDQRASACMVENDSFIHSLERQTGSHFGATTRGSRRNGTVNVVLGGFFLGAVFFDEIQVFAQVPCVCLFGGIPDHRPEPLLGILDVRLVVAPNPVPEALVAKGFGELPLLSFRNVFHESHHVVVEGLLHARFDIALKKCASNEHVSPNVCEENGFERKSYYA